ncbi:MAG: hypothetical protein WC375_05635 [Methanomassiliicoccales archaeon]|jgi:O-acetyl-ADP-ribose deacetylase (regulator of RNase III)
MTKIQYITGDATQPMGDGRKFVIHCCNDVGGWGSGFVVAISKKWAKPEAEYRKWAKEGMYIDHGQPVDFILGSIQSVKVEPNIVVVNMIGQRDVKPNNKIPPVRYEAIRQCLSKVSELAKKYSASVHAPRFGAGLAGGEWTTIEKIIEETLCKNDISITIYDLPDTSLVL